MQVLCTIPEFQDMYKSSALTLYKEIDEPPQDCLELQT
jgi:hypothetical protein